MANRFLNNIRINDEYTLPAADGTADQIIVTDGAGNLSFIDTTTISVGESEQVHIACKNTSGVPISKGDPVYITGTVGTSFRVQIAAADASNSAKMPAVGLAESDLANNAEGYVIVSGVLKNLTTDPLSTGDGTPSSNDTVYVKAGGGLTRTKPTGSGNLIQNVGKVGRVNSANAGSIAVSTIMRTNDVPNLTTGKIWVGSSTYTTESTVVHLDESNGRMGIGTTSPSRKLDISANVNDGIRLAANNALIGGGADGGDTQLLYWNGSTAYYGRSSLGGSVTQHEFRTSGATRMLINSSGNVGIGTTSPQEKLDISAGSIRLDDNQRISWASTDANIGRVRITGSEPNDFIAFVTDNSERMRLTNTGLGIGTTSPNHKLDIENASSAASIRLKRVDTNDSLILLEGSSYGYLQNTTGPLGLGGSNDERDILIDTNGNVGIGTTSPASPLTIKSNSFSSAQSGFTLEGNTNTNAIVRIAERSTDGARLHMYDGGVEKIAFYTDGTDNHISAGNIGIGTTSPTQKLHVSGNARVTGAYYDSNNSAGTSGQVLSSTATGTDWVSLSEIQGVDGSGTANYVTKWSDADSITDSIIYDNGTNVGIGTTSPSEKLHVAGNVTADEYKYNGAERVESKNWKYIAAVTAGNYEELGQWRVTEGNVVLRITVQSNTSSNSGTAVYMFQGGFDQATDGWFELLPAFKGGGHGDAQDGWKVLWYDNASYTYKLAVGVPSGLANKTLHVSVELLGNPNGDSYYQYTALSTTGAIPSYSLDRTTSYSHRDLVSSDSITAQYNAANYTTLGYDSLNTYGGSQVFKIAGAEKMRIDSSGNVGIGTTSPATKLDVSGGNIRRTSDANNYAQLGAAGGGGFINGYSGGSEKFIIRSYASAGVQAFFTAGNVGIGTTSPAKKLEVDGTVHLGSSGNDVSIGASNSSVIFMLRSGYNYIQASDASGALMFRTGGANNRMIIDSSGNVGIGTISPDKKLEVSGDIKISGGDYNGLYFENAAGTTKTLLYQHASYDALVIKDIVNNADRITFKNNGRVGIGTTSPSEELHISSVNPGIRLQDSDGTDTFGRVHYSGTSLYFYSRNNTSNGNYIWIGSNGTTDTEFMRINSSGNVGIGTAGPSQKLTVEGNIELGTGGYIYGDTTTPRLRLNHTYGSFLQYGSSSYVGVGSNVVTFRTSSSERMRIDSSGNVLVNKTSSTGDIFQVQGNNNVYSLRLDGSSTVGQSYGLRVRAGTSSADKSMLVENTGGTDLFLVRGDGNVGIGTASPEFKLHVLDQTSYGGIKVSGNNAPGITIEDDSDNAYSRIVAQNGGELRISADVPNLASGFIAFRTAGDTERMRITSTGNVGIGQTNPTNRLRIDAAAGQATTLSNSITNAAVYINSDTANGSNNIRIGESGSGSYFLQVSNSSGTTPYAINLNPFGGNVGIGTPSPGEKLEVYDGSIKLYDGTRNLIVGEEGSSSYQIKSSGYLVIDATSGIQINKTTSGNVTIASGNVGIGTTSPTLGKLHVAQSSDTVSSGITVEGISGGNTARLWVDGATRKLNAGGSNTMMQFDTSKVVFPSGNVGIGATSPGDKLTVQDGTITSTDSSGTNYAKLDRFSGLTLKGNGAGTRGVQTPNADALTLGTNNTERIRITSTGDVGIGTTSPSYKLDVDGGIKAGGKVTYTKSYSSLDTTGNAVAGITTGSNGGSCNFTFTCTGSTGGYQRIVYSCHCVSTTWNTTKVIDEGTNDFDVEASANGTTITFTFKSTSGTKYYSPTVLVEAFGTQINSTYA